MNAETLWKTWQTIVRSDALRGALTNSSTEEAKRALATLTPEERAIFDHYAGLSVSSDMYVGVYRKFLFDLPLSGLKLLPISNHAFEALDIPHRAWLQAFNEHIGYRDDGPNFWKTADEFLRFMQGREPFTSGPLSDAIVLDLAATALARDLAKREHEVWNGDEPTELEPIDPTRKFIQRGNARSVATAHDLTAWIENPRDFDPKGELPAERCFWAVYFETPESTPEHVELSERAADLFDALVTPRSCRELGAMFEDFSEDDALEIMSSLYELGFVRPLSR